MPVAEIIAIGTELLLGEIQDTNTRFITRTLRDIGLDIYRSTMIGDNVERIALVLQEAMQRSNIIVTTGGLGPTVDDPTRQAVASAIGVETEFRPELWEQIQNRFQRFNRQATENNRRQAYVPQGALAVENPVGTAPAFIVERPGLSIICLPGVPREMEYLLENTVVPYLRQRFDLQGIIKARVLHAAGVGESQVDEWVGDLETLSNPTVGLAAHAGQIDIRVTAKAGSEAEADAMLAPLLAEIRSRLGDHIYGADAQTLPDALYERLNGMGWRMQASEHGLGGELVKRLPGMSPEQMHTHPLPCTLDELRQEAGQMLAGATTDFVLAASLLPGAEKQTLTLLVAGHQFTQETTRSYGGPPANGSIWAANTALDYARRNIPTPPTKES